MIILNVCGKFEEFKLVALACQLRFYEVTWVYKVTTGSCDSCHDMFSVCF